jgi:hypothetical protein
MRGVFQEVPEGRQTGVMIGSFRQRKSFVAVALLAIFLLLFPTFSTADDFHVCHLSLERMLASRWIVSLPHISLSAARPTEETPCVACLWGNADTFSLATAILLEPVAKTFLETRPLVLSLSRSELFLTRSERAPPLG